MRKRLGSFFATALCVSACSPDQEPSAAAAVFTAFQDALRRGDAAACRNLVTAESAKALDAVDWHAVRERRSLEVTGSERGALDYRVKVADPNDGGRAAEFVVVREYGRLVVDLVATAGMHTEVREATAGREELAPRELTPADRERIRQFELSQPPRR